MSDESGGVLVDLERDGVAHPALWCDDRLHANSGGHERIAAAAAAALGYGAEDRSRSLPLPDPAPRSAAARYRDDAVWMGRHLAPWLVRRARGRSSGDGRSAKRPVPTAFEAKQQDLPRVSGENERPREQDRT